MKTFFALLLTAVMVFTMTLVPASAEPSETGVEENTTDKMAEVPKNEEAYKEGELLVVMKESVSDRKAENVANAQGDQLKEAVDVGIGGDEQTVAVVETDSSNANQLENSMEEYAKRDDVEFVQPNFIYKSSDEPLSELQPESQSEKVTNSQDTQQDVNSQEESLQNQDLEGGDSQQIQGQSKKVNSNYDASAIEKKSDRPNLESLQWILKKDAIDAREGWDILEANKKRTVKVAVLDTGLDVNHPDFKYKDKQGNERSVIDKTHSVQTYYSKISKISKDPKGHGTHVAGIIAAANNGYGVTGVGAGTTNSAIEIMGIQVFHPKNEYGNTFSLARGVDYAAKNGAKVMNMSLGSIKGVDDKILRKSISSAYDKGITVICAAGNDQTDGVVEVPACYGKTISVANSGKHHLLHETSTYGRAIDIAAPGVEILSTWHRKLKNQGKYEFLTGTSMATPVVSGVAAMIYAVDNSVGTSGSYVQRVRGILCKTATDMYSPGKDRYSGYGMVNSRRALTAATGGGLSLIHI